MSVVLMQSISDLGVIKHCAICHQPSFLTAYLESRPLEDHFSLFGSFGLSTLEEQTLVGCGQIDKRLMMSSDDYLSPISSQEN